jgi:hypothetical protein
MTKSITVLLAIVAVQMAWVDAFSVSKATTTLRQQQQKQQTCFSKPGFTLPSTATPEAEAATTTDAAADAGAPSATSESTDTADAEIPTNLPSDCGMDYIPLATMLATGQLAEADQVCIVYYVSCCSVLCWYLLAFSSNRVYK